MSLTMLSLENIPLWIKYSDIWFFYWLCDFSVIKNKILNLLSKLRRKREKLKMLPLLIFLF